MAEPFHNSCHSSVSLEDQEIHTENAQDKTGQELVNRLNSLEDTFKLDYSVDETKSSFNSYYLRLFLYKLVVRNT